LNIIKLVFIPFNKNVYVLKYFVSFFGLKNADFLFVKQKYCLIKFSLMNCMPGLLTQMLRQILPIKKYLPNFNVVKNAQWLKEISKTV